MDSNEMLQVKIHLSNINVNVTAVNYNNVGPDWRDIDYVPGYNQFYYICSGEGWLKILDKEYLPTPGQLYLLPAGIKQSFSVINQNPFTKYWCHFTAEIGKMNIFDIVKLPYYIEVKDDKLLIDIFNDIITSFNGNEISSTLLSKSSILRLIGFFLDNSSTEKISLVNSATTTKLNLVLNYIEHNFDKNINIEELSKIACLHPNYFIRLFKKHIGTSPIDYINKRRIEEAKKLLASSDLTLSCISNKIGTNDIYYLSKMFKGYTGLSPSAFRHMFSSIPHDSVTE